MNEVKWTHLKQTWKCFISKKIKYIRQLKKLINAKENGSIVPGSGVQVILIIILAMEPKN